MAISRLHTWSAGEILLASDLNSEFNNIINNGADLVSPFTKAISMGGFSLNFDVANSIALTSTTNGLTLTGGALNTPQGASIASSSTVNLDTATGNYPQITGVVAITAITLSQGRFRFVEFAGALTLTNGASLILPGGSNITTAAGDCALFFGEASSVVRCIFYTKAASIAATLAGTEALTNKTYNGNTFTAGTGVLTIAAAKTLTANSTLTLAGTDGKTLTVSNNLTLAGTDATTTTFPTSSSHMAALDLTGQVLSGGATVTAASISTGNYTVNCGTSPLQYITNGGAFTLTAPAADGSCVLLVTNNGSAGTVTFSGFTVGTTGDPLTTTNTNKFKIYVDRINGTSSYFIKALQ